MFDLGIQELIVIFVVALIVFGPKRMPELGRTLGKGILELKKAVEGVRDQIHAESEIVHESVGNAKPEEKKNDTAGVEAGSVSVTGESSTELRDTEEDKRDLQGPSETDKFYRVADEGLAAERKEGPVDGR
ncbi:MAG TPA: twin-arginine translocase TatA/TatE family subunit [Thermodesulfovibrionales bacterium]|nr:twin-arginine translocase TatA/TatE family subunit [Thermodesulfovibrionales bacterium]